MKFRFDPLIFKQALKLIFVFSRAVQDRNGFYISSHLCYQTNPGIH